MRSIALRLALVSMVAAIGCSGERALAPKAGTTGQLSDLPPESFADYSRVSLPGSETAVALNDSGDVVGATASGGVLWHGALHERIALPIIPTAIANDGTVAGSVDGHAATWKSGRVTILDTATSVALAICRCESATVVGSVQVDGVTHAAIWVDGIPIDAGLPPSSSHAEFSSIAAGFIVGNAIVHQPDPRAGGFADLEAPYSWSHSGGWRPLIFGQLSVGAITSLNSHGFAVGVGAGPNAFTTIRGILFDLAAGTAQDEYPINQTIINILPTGINDSNLVSATAYFSPQETGPQGTIALVGSVGGGLILPPGVLGDQALGINSAGVIAGQSNNLPVLWVPNA
ncbi:MAG: hypothetical protein ABI446_11875 [Gemmatimonadaceae bacterium]